jgi:cyclopropane fatty-acyl-phospholipid synthase-like methyltransferase
MIIMAYCRGLNHRDRLVATLAGLAVVGAIALWPPRPALAWGTDDAAMADEIASMLQLRPGSVVAEIGAGHGQMAIRMARKVGSAGHVYATEIDAARLSEIRRRVDETDLGNVTVVEAAPTDTGLPAGCCDGIYMIGVYHHISDPGQLTRAFSVRLSRAGASS